MTKISSIKKIIKNDPIILLRRPWLLLLLPILFIIIVWNRLKYDKTIVYFLDTNIINYLSNKELTQIKNIEINKITSFQKFQELIEKRLSEDPSIDRSYFNLCQKRFESGASAYVYYIEKLPISYIFTVTDTVNISQVNLKLTIPKDTFVFIDLYTFKKYRGCGYHQNLYNAVVLTMKKIGYNQFWAWIMAHNQISIKAHCKFGINNVTKIIVRKSFMGFSKLHIKDVSFLTDELIITSKPSE